MLFTTDPHKKLRYVLPSRPLDAPRTGVAVATIPALNCILFIHHVVAVKIQVERKTSALKIGRLLFRIGGKPPSDTAQLGGKPSFGLDSAAPPLHFSPTVCPCYAL